LLMQGMRDGVGIMRWVDGTSYEGEWRQDMLQGFGVEVYPDGGVYSGQFHGNARHGIGMYAYADGQAYAGQFRFGLQVIFLRPALEATQGPNDSFLINCLTNATSKRFCGRLT